MNNYSVVSKYDENGKTSDGFRKIISALTNYENHRESLDTKYRIAVRMYNSTATLSPWCSFWYNRHLERSAQPKTKLEWVSDKLHDWSFWLTAELFILVDQGYLTEEDARDIYWKEGEDTYENIRNIIRNGEVFFMNDESCKFINKWSTYVCSKTN